jgi:hydroxymethylbilane synthase
MPAVSQGIIGIEVLFSNVFVKEVLSEITDKDALIMAEAERVFLRKLEGGCQVPVACYSQIMGEQFRFSGMVCELNGENQLKVELSGSLQKASEIASDTADQIIQLGGDRILKEIKEQSVSGK